MTELARVRTWADALIRLHLDGSWSFAFDHARTRAGLCDYTAKRISVSRHIARLSEDDDIHQVLLHEVAHAIAGRAAGHGAHWRAVAADLGYVGGRTHDGPLPTELAPWVGTCPNGHLSYRYRRPTRPSSCGVCSRRFDPALRIRWARR
ncbi:MAG: SprT-like domain-containing protein [Protaetiibacter sp.]